MLGGGHRTGAGAHRQGDERRVARAEAPGRGARAREKTHKTEREERGVRGEGVHDGCDESVEM
jgi:hypothetical protein